MKHRKSVLTGLIGISICLMIIPGCHCNNGEQKGDKDSLALKKETGDSISMETMSQKDSAKILTNINASNAIQKVTKNKIDWKRFVLTDFDRVVDSNKVKSFQEESNFYSKYATYLKASPDKNYYLDLGTDNIVEDPSSGSMMTGDPEGALYIINVPAKTRTEIVSLGGSGNLIEANWLDKDELSILCSLPGKDPKKDDMYLYIYNAQTKRLRSYMYQ